MAPADIGLVNYDVAGDAVVRFMGGMACISLGLIYVGKATGATEQYALAPEDIWVWWIAAGLQVIIGVLIWIGGYK